MADALRGGIVINEILVDPNGSINFDTDGSGTAENTDEFVELFNASDVPIDIGGLQLWDQGVGNWFTFPEGTILQAGGHAVVISGVSSGGSLPAGGPDDLFFDAGRGSPLINNGGDNVTLLDPDANSGDGAFIQATFNGDTLDDPTAGVGGYGGFPAGASRTGTGEDFGDDTDGQSLQRASDGADVFTDDTPTPGVTNVCFTNGTAIATPDGCVPAEHLSVGDIVETLDHGPQPLLWILHRTWTVQEMIKDPKLVPVLIPAHAFGNGLPDRDLRVSQHHRILVTGKIAQRMFDTSEVLVPAKCFVGHLGVKYDTPTTPVTYVHLMLSQHEVLVSNGTPSESLYLGQETLRALPPSALAEIDAIFGLALSPPAPARRFATGRRAARLLERHERHARPIAREFRHQNAATA